LFGSVSKTTTKECNTFAKQIRIPSELQVLREHEEHLSWVLQVHRVLGEHGWKDNDWQLPNNFPPVPSVIRVDIKKPHHF
jgi:hypothetical protein